MVSKPTAAEPAGSIRASKPKSLQLAGWNGNGSHAAPTGTMPRPRMAASTEGLARAFRIASGGMDKTAAQGKVQSLRSKAPLPVGWKPTPTKTSILREAAMQAAKDAKLRSAFVKPGRNESPVRGTAVSLARTRSSKSLTASPEKSRLPVSQGASRLVRGRDEGQSQADTDSIALPSEHQEVEISPPGNLKIKLETADPIFALHSPFGMVRRLHNSSEESHQSSEWSVDTSSQAVRRRELTPQSPSTKQNEEFSPVHELQIEASTSPAKKEGPSISDDFHRHYPGLTPSPKHRKPLSTRLLVNSPMDPGTKDLPFEVFDFDDDYDDYEQSPKKSPARTGSRGRTSLKVPSSKQRSERHDSRTFTTSPRVRYNAQADSSDDTSFSKVKPILTIGRSQQRRNKDANGSRDSIKSVSWDPAIVAVGRCISGTDASDSNGPTDARVSNQELNDQVEFAMKDYLNTVTQSFAKLKKSNPKVITQLLAALRDLSDDESNTDTEHKRKLRLKAKPASSTLSMDRLDGLSMKLGEKEAVISEPLRPSEQCSQIQDRLASVIESMQHPVTDEKSNDSWKEEVLEAAENSGCPPKGLPNTHDMDKGGRTLYNSSWRKATPIPGSAMQTPIRMSIKAADNALSSPAWIPAKEDVVRAKDSTLPPPKLNPQAPAFTDFSFIKYVSNDKLQNKEPEVQSSLPSETAELAGVISERNNDDSQTKGKWKDTPRPQIQASIEPTEKLLNSMEPIWINTSQLIKASSEFGVGKDGISDKKTLASKSPVDIMSAFTQPQIFTVPPGFIPLVPHPGFLSHMAPYQATYPQPASLPSGIATITSTSNRSEDHIPSEDEPGRESLLLEAEWSQTLLKNFQAKYPLTGTRASATDTAVTERELVEPCLVTPEVVGSVPMFEHPPFQQAGFQPRTRRPFVKKTGATLQQLAKKTRASVIQQALEVKILQFKEKKAAETKEIQKKQIEKVEKILPLVRQQMKAKFANENLAPEFSEGNPLQIWQRAPTVLNGSTNHSSEDSEMTSVRRREAGSSESDQRTVQDQAIIDNSRVYKDMDLVDYDDLSLSSSSINTIVANHDMQLPAKSWQRRPLDTQVSNITRDRQEKGGKQADLSQSLQSLAATPDRDMKLFKSLFGKLREMSSVDDGQSLNSEEVVQDQVLSLKSAWEHVRSTEWQNQYARSPNANPSFSTAKLSGAGKGSEHSTSPQVDASVNIPYETSTYPGIGLRPEFGSADPWELLTAEQWENQASGNGHIAGSVAQATEAGSNIPFKAPKYLWDFLDLEFKLDDLQNLSSLARASSRSSSSAASEALSDALMDARTRLSLSQAKTKAQGRIQKATEASTGTVVKNSPVKSRPEAKHHETHLNFDWVPHRLLSQSTVEVLSDSSDYLEMKPSGKSKSKQLKKAGRLMALVEGSAAEDAYLSKGRGKNGNSRVM